MSKPSPNLMLGPQEQPVILLGGSTGGCEALTAVLGKFPADAPPVVCVQHIPAVFSAVFAEQLSAHTKLRVCEARSGDILERGHAYIAPGGKHLRLCEPYGHRVELDESAPMHLQRPSIDVTFTCAAYRVGWRAVAALLSGKGVDGVEGLRAIRSMGGFTLAQDEATSVAYGMPGEAIRRGAACSVAPLNQIAEILLAAAARRQR